MDSRIILIFSFLLITISLTTVQGNVFTSIVHFFAPQADKHHVDISSRRQKRITSDEGLNAEGLARNNYQKPHIPGNLEAVRRSVDEELQEIWEKGRNQEKQTRSLSEEELDAAGKTKILEQRATLRIKDAEDGKASRKSKFENINSREEKEMSSIRTLSSLSVPVDEQSGSGDEQETLTEAYTWPKGRYGLPKAVVGCPSTFGIRWKTGFRYHDTEDDGTENQRSDVFHLAANFSEDGISHEFCIKDDVEGEGTWPPGKYCIYKRGPSCPIGLREGFVIWDDENTDNQNDKGGALPEGEYTEDTKIFFCCSTSGSVDNQISLPAKKPFFLFAFESIRCQRVLNMKSTSEFIKFDDEDHGNTDHEGGEYPYGIHKFQKDHMLFLCYYEPNKPVKSYEAEISSNFEEETADDVLDQESIRQSEEIMKEFMKQTGGVEDESSKRERTKTIIKTIKVLNGYWKQVLFKDVNVKVQVPVKNKVSPIATVVGLVMGSLIIGSVIITITKMVVYNKQIPTAPKVNQSYDAVETTWVQQESKQIVDATENDDDDVESVASDISEKSSPDCFTPPEHDSWSDLEEDNELVEDQLLPDSELKGGLELLFLKQQRHYWNQRHDKHNHSH